MSDIYRNYFNIDPEYFPVVNQEVIEHNPDVWKKFYPHETFVSLLKKTVEVLSRKTKLSIWVEGAYGTGKSHAVLTLKKLLDATPSEVEPYFEKYTFLSKDLRNSFLSVKNSGKILTVHRYGSSSIHSDHNLVFAIQESVENALKEAGIQNKGKLALKGATINWLKKKANRSYFNDLITDTYRDLFGGDTVEDVITRLETGREDAVAKTIDAIFTVADRENIRALELDVPALCTWIKDVIAANKLKAMVFIWDEFTEYFHNNARNLTGFQQICELSETVPFYFMLVTHVSQSIAGNSDQDFKKLNDRFVSPHSVISLPENIAFQLMGAALEKKDDSVVQSEWTDIVEDLISRTDDSRQLVQRTAGIADAEMRGIIPIHPYAALLLKHISSAFDSNQRSMFDFIKNDRGEEIKGFQWFIDNFGPYGENPLLTIDMLWDFFYEKGSTNLLHDVKVVLDYFPRVSKQQNLDNDQQRVLKSILLLLAISQHAGNAVDMFVPNEKNLSMAFEGSDLDHHAVQCAKRMVEMKILFLKKQRTGDTFGVYNNEGEIDLAPYEAEIDKKSTTALITEELVDKSTVTSALDLSDALKLRYEVRHVTSHDFDTTIKALRNQESKFANKILAIACYAKDEEESISLGTKIKAAVKDSTFKMIFIDTTRTPLGHADFEIYRHDAALAKAQTGKDNGLAKQYATDAKNTLKQWKDRISKGAFTVFSEMYPEGERAASLDAMFQLLMSINRQRYTKSLESSYTVASTMYTASNLKVGVECGCMQKVSGVYRSENATTKLEKALEGAWNVPEYWKSAPHLPISKIKVDADKLIQKGFKNSGRISIRELYEEFKVAPYGFMPCNLTAFILGFILKEYADGSFCWSDNLTTETLTVAKLKDMVDEIIKNEINPILRYKDKYIVAMTDEEKAFNELSSSVFRIPLSQCSSITQTRERIRMSLKSFDFPIWTLCSLFADETPATDAIILGRVIDCFCGIANSHNLTGSKSENDIAMEIGRLSREHKTLEADLQKLFCKEKCIEGMKAYLRTFDEGILPHLAETIQDQGNYLKVLSGKFDADEAVWLWNKETVHRIIREVILEYRIIAESQKFIPQCNTFSATITEWVEKCDNIRIAFDAAKSKLGSAAPFLACLCNLKRTRQLNEMQKEDFLEKLLAHGDAFNAFYNDQTPVFRSLFEMCLDGLEDDEIRDVFTTLPRGTFVREKGEYYLAVEQTVTEYKENRKGEKLKQEWKNRTGTNSPRDWSTLHQMPILCLVPEQEQTHVKEIFDILNLRKPDETQIDKALTYLQSATFLEGLNDLERQNEAFRKGVIRNYSVMLPNVQTVKDQLARLPVDPYDWMTDPAVEKKLKQLAESEYNRGGYDKALEKINDLSLEDLKSYLRELIKDNMVVGMEIIKGNE